MTLWKWSKTAANNGTADSSCPFPEGMAPGAVNDGARGLMAAVAKYRDDVSGASLTGGSGAAYTLASSQAFDAPASLGGAQLAFTPHATNSGAATLNVDGLGARPLRLAPGLELPPGTLVQGTPYVVLYNGTDGAFYLRNFLALPYAVPVGGLMPFIGAAPPTSNFVLPYGQAISRTAYAALFALVGTTFGGGDGTTTFNIPDLRGRVPVGKDDMGGVVAARITSGGSGINGASTGATGGSEISQLSTANLPPYTPSGSITIGGSYSFSALQFLAGASTGGTNVAVNSANITIPGSSFTGSFTGTAQGGTSQNFPNMPPAIVLPYLLRVV
jgi:microcystin-dependent protein